MRASRNIYAPNLNLEYLAQALTAWYRNEQYDVERSDISRGSVQLRCRRSNGKEAKPSLIVTMRQQGPGLTVDIEVGKWARPILIAALSFWAIMALLGLCALSSGDFVGAIGFVLFVGAIAFCAFSVFRLSRNSKIPARTFTVIERFVTAPNSISASFPVSPTKFGSNIIPPLQQHGNYGLTGGQRQTWIPPVQQRGNNGLAGGQRQTWSTPAHPSGRDEPIGPLAPNTADGLGSDGVSPSRPPQPSLRDEPIVTLAPDTISGKSTSPADDLVASTFSQKESRGTKPTKVGAATRACSCGEMNPADVNFCERCGKPLTSPM